MRSCVRGQRCRKIRLDQRLQPVTNIWVACLGGNCASPRMDLSFHVSSSSPFFLFFFVSSSTSSRDLMSVAMPKLSLPTRTDVHCCTCSQHILLPIVLGFVRSVKNMSGARLLCWCFLSLSVQQRRRVFVFCFIGSRHCQYVCFHVEPFFYFVDVVELPSECGSFVAVWRSCGVG